MYIHVHVHVYACQSVMYNYWNAHLPFQLVLTNTSLPSGTGWPWQPTTSWRNSPGPASMATCNPSLNTDKPPDGCYCQVHCTMDEPHTDCLLCAFTLAKAGINIVTQISRERARNTKILIAGRSLRLEAQVQIYTHSLPIILIL